MFKGLVAATKIDFTFLFIFILLFLEVEFRFAALSANLMSAGVFKTPLCKQSLVRLFIQCYIYIKFLIVFYVSFVFGAATRTLFCCW